MVLNEGLLKRRCGMNCDKDSSVCCRGRVALPAKMGRARRFIDDVEPLLSDPLPDVQIAAAELLCRLDCCKKALPVLAERIQDERETVALQAGRGLEMIGAKAAPRQGLMFRIIEKYKGNDGIGKKYKD